MNDGYVCSSCMVYLDWCESYTGYSGAYVCPVCELAHERPFYAEDFGLGDEELIFNYQMYQGDFSGSK